MLPWREPLQRWRHTSVMAFDALVRPEQGPSRERAIPGARVGKFASGALPAKTQAAAPHGNAPGLGVSRVSGLRGRGKGVGAADGAGGDAVRARRRSRPTAAAGDRRWSRFGVPHVIKTNPDPLSPAKLARRPFARFGALSRNFASVVGEDSCHDAVRREHFHEHEVASQAGRDSCPTSRSTIAR
jgi:hypothetical protein